MHNLIQPFILDYYWLPHLPQTFVFALLDDHSQHNGCNHSTHKDDDYKYDYDCYHCRGCATRRLLHNTNLQAENRNS